MMRAARIVGPRTLDLAAIDAPSVGAQEVAVRLEGCGLCGSDLPLWQGRPWFEYPQPAGAPGHEAWGVVEEAGRDVSSVAPGDRVAGLFHGAFAELATTQADHVLRVPTAAQVPFAGEPLACAANAVRRSGLLPADRVVVVGVGFIGAAITAFAVAQGAEVLAISRRPFARGVATRLGAKEAVTFDGAARQAVVDWTGGGMADVVFEVTGRQDALDLATGLVRVRGKLVIAGYHQDGPRTVDMRAWNWMGLDVINAHEREPAAYMRGMQEAAAFVASERVDLAPLYTHRFRLDELDRAFGMMEERPDGFLKAVVCP